MARPTQPPDFATAPGVRAALTGVFRNAGFIGGQMLEAHVINALWGEHGDWLSWLATPVDHEINMASEHALGWRLVNANEGTVGSPAVTKRGIRGDALGSGAAVRLIPTVLAAGGVVPILKEVRFNYRLQGSGTSLFPSLGRQDYDPAGATTAHATGPSLTVPAASPTAVVWSVNEPLDPGFGWYLSFNFDKANALHIAEIYDARVIITMPPGA